MAKIMELSVHKHDLKYALTIAKRFTARRSTLAILSTVRLSASDGEVTVTATDLDATVTVTISGSSYTDGAVCVPVKQLADLVAKYPDERIDITATGDEHKAIVDLECGTSKDTIKGRAAADYPVIPEPGDGLTWYYLGDVKDILTKVASGASKEKSRPILNGVHLKGSPSLLTIESADGYKALRESVSVSGCDSWDITIPAPAVKAFAAGLKRSDNPVSIAADDTLVYMRTHDTLVSYHIIEGRFPSLDEFAMPENTGSIIVKTDELKRALAVCQHDTLVLDITGDENGLATLYAAADSLSVSHEMMAGIYGEPVRRYAFARSLVRSVTDKIKADFTELAAAPGGMIYITAREDGATPDMVCWVAMPEDEMAAVITGGDGEPYDEAANIRAVIDDWYPLRNNRGSVGDWARSEITRQNERLMALTGENYRLVESSEPEPEPVKVPAYRKAEPHKPRRVQDTAQYKRIVKDHAPAPVTVTPEPEPVAVDEVEPVAIPEPTPEPEPVKVTVPAPAYTLKTQGTWTWLTFDSKPALEWREQLKTQGWRWSRKRAAWYHTGGAVPVLGNIADAILDEVARRFEVPALPAQCPILLPASMDEWGPVAPLTLSPDEVRTITAAPVMSDATVSAAEQVRDNIIRLDDYRKPVAPEPEPPAPVRKPGRSGRPFHYIDEMGVEYHQYDTSTSRSYLPAGVAAHIRKALKRAFPGVKFSVRAPDRYSVRVGVPSGVDIEAVKRIACQYEGLKFDGMIDSQYNAKTWMMPDGTVIGNSTTGTGNSGGSCPAIDFTPPDGAIECDFYAYVFVDRC